MRVSTAYGYDQLAAHVGATQSRMLEAQNRVITGKRINTPSDDATGTKGLLDAGSLRAGIARYQSNLTTAKGVLSSAEATYSDIGDLMQQANTLTIQGGTATMDPASREAIAKQIDTLKERLVSLANEQAPDGRYLFGGRLTDAKPFSIAGNGTLAYAGDTTQPTIEVGPGEVAKVGEAGGELIGNAFASLSKLSDSLRSGDITALSNDRLTEITDSSNAILSARADVGRRMNNVTSAQSMHERRDTDLHDRESALGEVDYATAILDYTAAQSVYEAALQVASKGFSMGLMDFIR